MYMDTNILGLVVIVCNLFLYSLNKVEGEEIGNMKRGIVSLGCDSQDKHEKLPPAISPPSSWCH